MEEQTIQKSSQERLQEVKAEIASIANQIKKHEAQIAECTATIKTEKQAVKNATDAGMTADAETLTTAVKSLESAKRKLNKEKKSSQQKLEELKIEYRALIVTAGEEWLANLDNAPAEAIAATNTALSGAQSATPTSGETNVASTPIASEPAADVSTKSTTSSPLTAGMPAYDSVLALEKTLAAFNAYADAADTSYTSANQSAIILYNEAEVARLTRKYTQGEYSSTVNEELEALRQKLNG